MIAVLILVCIVTNVMVIATCINDLEMKRAKAQTKRNKRNGN